MNNSVTKLSKEHPTTVISCEQCNEPITQMKYSMRDYQYRMQYNGRTIYFCSWNCMRKWQRERGLTPEQISAKAIEKENKRSSWYTGGSN